LIIAALHAGCRCATDEPSAKVKAPCARADVICERGVTEVLTFHTLCDASGAAWSNHELFVASEHTTYVLTYPPSGGAPGSQPILLGADRDPLGTEAGVAVGDRVLFIGSHALGRGGAYSDLNHRLIRLGGTPSRQTKRITHVMPESDRFHGPLDAFGEELLDIRFPYAPPDKGGIEVGGVAHFEDTLFVGLRSPLASVHDTKQAIVIPWPNWRESMKSPQITPVYESAILLDLDGHGIRGMEFWPGAGGHLIIAGPPAGAVKKRKKKDFSLYFWSADGKRPPKRIGYIDPPHRAKPESVVVDLSTDEGDQVEIVLMFDEHGKPGCGSKTPRSERQTQGWRLTVANPWPKSP